jgi:hypothetical protein
MINIIYKGNIADLNQATADANRYLGDPLFHNDIIRKGTFDLADIDGTTIVNCILTVNLEATVETYWYWRKKVYGKEEPAHPERLFINLNRNDWSHGSLVNTIIHEAIHAIDSKFPTMSFGHGDNSPVGKKNTAPYWIGGRAEELITGQPGRLPLILVEDPENRLLSMFRETAKNNNTGLLTNQQNWTRRL